MDPTAAVELAWPMEHAARSRVELYDMVVAGTAPPGIIAIFDARPEGRIVYKGAPAPAPAAEPVAPAQRVVVSRRVGNPRRGAMRLVA